MFVCTDKTYSKLLLYPLYSAEYTFHMPIFNVITLRWYWDTHPTYAYLKETTGVTGVSPGLSIVDVAASASYVNFTDEVKQNEGG